MEDRLHDGVKQILVSTLKENLDAAKEELEKICEDEKLQPITYNHYFTNSIQKNRLQDLRKDIEKGFDDNLKLKSYESSKHELNDILNDSLVEVDMRKQACKEAKSALNAYYKV
jgi:hypothetical protein